MKGDNKYHLKKLFEQFKIPEQEALSELQSSKYTKDDCLNDTSIRAWTMEMVRNCRAYRMTDPMQHMTHVLQALDPTFRLYIVAPTENVMLDDYVNEDDAEDDAEEDGN